MMVVRELIEMLEGADPEGLVVLECEQFRFELDCVDVQRGIVRIIGVR